MPKRPSSIWKQERAKAPANSAETGRDRELEAPGNLKDGRSSSRALDNPSAKMGQPLSANSALKKPRRRHLQSQRVFGGEGAEQVQHQHGRTRKGTAKVGLEKGQWGSHSVVDRQAAAAVEALLSAHTGQRKGISLKSLTLAPKVQAKKATFRVTCQTLKHLPVIKDILEKTQLLNTHA